MRRLWMVFTPVIALIASMWWSADVSAVTPTASTYFVSENGTDTTGGVFGDCQFINPCATIGFVLSLASDGDFINLLAGTYIESATVDKSVNIGGPLSGFCDPVCATWQAPAGERNAVIQTGKMVTVSHLALIGGNIGSDNGGVFLASGANLRIESSTIAQGRAKNGGAIYQMTGSVVLTDTEAFLNQATDGDGGAIFSERGRVEVYDSLLRINNADNGGAIFLNNSGGLIGNTLFAGNNALDSGGAIQSTFFDEFDAPGDALIMQDVVFNNNSAESAGAVTAGYMEVTLGTFVQNSAEKSCGAIRSHNSLTMLDVHISENSAVEDGGGLCLDGNRREYEMEIDETTISHNTAGGDGGGLFVEPPSFGSGQTVEIGRTHIYSNSAASGGGVKIVKGNSSNPTISFYNSEITHNQAITGTGGGIESAASTTTSLFNVTVAANRSNVTGSGLNVISGTVQIGNSALANNTFAGSGQTLGLDLDCTGAVVSFGYNLIGKSTCAISGDPSGNQVGSSTTPVEAQLAQSAQAGVYEPVAGSPLIDAGDPNGCRTESGGGLPVDYFGNPRGATRCDIGAVELQGTPTAVTFNSQAATSHQPMPILTLLLMLTLVAQASLRAGQRSPSTN